MNLELKNKVAIVGGASMGIGYGIARVLAQEGVSIAICARREPALSEAAERLRKETGVRVLPIAADARKSDDCKRIVETVKCRVRWRRHPRQQRRRAAAGRGRCRSTTPRGPRRSSRT